MAKAVHTIPITQIILDEEIYPRGGVYPKRVSMFAENIRDGFEIDPIEVQIHPEYGDKYRILDGAHRWHAYKEIGATEIPVHVITLDGVDPLLYAAKKTIGPLNLAACGGMFFDRTNKINKIFLYSLYPEHPVYPV
jgi:hypothetical protein